MTGWLPATTAFAASAVEAVEALTVVLAVGTTRSWRSALSGAGWALVALAAIVVVFGPAIVRYVPLDALKIVIGIFLTLFGLAWLRKAILRYGGRKALRDETAIYARQTQRLRSEPAGGGRDRLGFATAYNAVLLEGLEVVVIVVTVGAASAGGLLPAALGAAAAVGIVAAAGFALRRPLRRVPENALKFVVGIMLTSFGTLWTGEGLGIAWWGGDTALAAIVTAYALVAVLAIGLTRRGERAAMRRAA